MIVNIGVYYMLINQKITQLHIRETSEVTTVSSACYLFILSC